MLRSNENDDINEIDLNDNNEHQLYKKAVKLLKSFLVPYSQRIDDTICHLSYLNIDVNDLNRLNIIHIAGTKGKGSTCATIESILRSYGFKTGLFTSPHLTEVRERIRLNGIPIEKQRFTKLANEIYTKIVNENNVNVNLPTFFGFITLMAFCVFLEENVDVAIFEVGVGGINDQTNIIQKPIVTGITSLGYDHMNILGNSITEIAEKKGGIMKPGVTMFIGHQIYKEVIPVLFEKAKSLSCDIFLCPELSTYKTMDNNEIKLSLKGEVQKENATLALQISRYWLKKMNILCEPDLEKSNIIKNDLNSIPVSKAFKLTKQDEEGLINSCWPGRFQIVKYDDRITYYLDGAHTKESLKLCSNWFINVTKTNLITNNNIIKVLILSVAKGRDCKIFIDQLNNINFDLILITKSYLKNKNGDEDKNDDKIMMSKNLNAAFNYYQSIINEKEKIIEKFESIKSTITWLNDYVLNNQNINQIQVLVTGSLRLVGKTLKYIRSKKIMF